jgi:hypothetical protein
MVANVRRHATDTTAIDVASFHYGETEAAVGFSVRRTYRLRRGGASLELTDERPAACDDLSVLAQADICAPIRPVTDVVVLGDVRPSARCAAAIVSATVGPVRKRARICGVRRLERGPYGPRLSEPEDLRVTSLSWMHAYGGGTVPVTAPAKGPAGSRWEAAFDEGTDEDAAQPPRYPRNPTGRGYRAGGVLEALLDVELPSIEDPDAPLTPESFEPSLPWWSRPLPVGFAPIAADVFPRSAHWLPYGFDEDTESRTEEVRRGWLARGILRRTEIAASPLAWSAAAPGLGTHQLAGGERFELVGFDPAGPLRGQLPNETPRVTARFVGARERRPEMHLKTVLFEPSASRVTLTWTALVPTLVPFDEGALEQIETSVDVVREY